MDQKLLYTKFYPFTHIFLLVTTQKVKKGCWFWSCNNSCNSCEPLVALISLFIRQSGRLSVCLSFAKLEYWIYSNFKTSLSLLGIIYGFFDIFNRILDLVDYFKASCLSISGKRFVLCFRQIKFLRLLWIHEKIITISILISKNEASLTRFFLYVCWSVKTLKSVLKIKI